MVYKIISGKTYKFVSNTGTICYVNDPTDRSQKSHLHTLWEYPDKDTFIERTPFYTICNRKYNGIIPNNIKQIFDVNESFDDTM